MRAYVRACVRTCTLHNLHHLTIPPSHPHILTPSHTHTLTGTGSGEEVYGTRLVDVWWPSSSSGASELTDSLGELTEPRGEVMLLGVVERWVDDFLAG